MLASECKCRYPLHEEGCPVSAGLMESITRRDRTIAKHHDKVRAYFALGLELLRQVKKPSVLITGKSIPAMSDTPFLGNR